MLQNRGFNESNGTSNNYQIFNHKYLTNNADPDQDPNY